MRRILSLVLSFCLVLTLCNGMATAQAEDSAENLLNAEASDFLIVDTANTDAQLFYDEDRLSYNKSAVTSLAKITNGVCAVRVSNTWRWSNQADFYTEVVSSGTWVYSANAWANMDVPVITYNTVAGTKVSFKLAMRKEITSWEDVSIKVSYGDEAAYTPSSNFLFYTEKDYSCDFGTMNVRNYELIVPSNGKLIITLPTAAKIKEKATVLNPDPTAFIHSSALLIPATATASNITYIGAGDEDVIPADALGWNRGFSTKYGYLGGAAHLGKVSLTDGWLWGNPWGNPSYLIPELNENKVFKIDGNNEFSLTYNVKAGTTLVIPVVMKSVIWDALTDENDLKFNVDDSTGYKSVTPEYIETSAKWSDSDTIKIVMRKYVIRCEKASIVNITISTETLNLMITAAGTINGAALSYLENGGAFVCPAYGLEKLQNDVITNNGNGTSIHNYYYQSNAVSSEVFAYNDGIAISQITNDWHWFISDNRFFSDVAENGSYVYSVAYNRDITPELYYAFDNASTVSFKVGITEGVASWDDVKVEYSANGSSWLPTQIRWRTDSFSTSRGNGTQFPINVRFCEANIPTAGYLRISLPNGNTAATNWNKEINDNNQLLGYSLFVTGVTAKEGCYVTGDLNNDSKLTAADLVALSKMLLNGEENIAGELNFDGAVDIRDLIRLKKLLSNVSMSSFSLLATSGDELFVEAENAQFTWSSCSTADNYILQIQRLDEETSIFEDDLIVNEISETEYTTNQENMLSADSIYRWRVFACAGMNSILGNGEGKDKEGWNYFYTLYDNGGSSVNTGLDFEFDGSISKEVLCNYLSRSVTMTGEDNVLYYEDFSYEGLARKRDILYSGAKYISRAAAVWNPTITEIERFDNQKNYMASVHNYDDEIIFEACIFENISRDVEQIPVPSRKVGIIFTPYMITGEAVSTQVLILNLTVLFQKRFFVIISPDLLL